MIWLQITFFINDGNGHFTRGPQFGKEYAPTRNIVVSDIDNDGDIDILITNRGRTNEICLNDGKGNFTENLGFGTKEDSTIDVEVADIDGDNDNDLILANRDEQQNFIYINTGDLNFSEKIPFGGEKDNSRSVEVSDLNNDGFLDIIEAGISSPNSVYFGDRGLSFLKKYSLIRVQVILSVLLLQILDADGNKDIVIGNYGEPNAVFMNKQKGTKWERKQLSEKEF